MKPKRFLLTASSLLILSTIAFAAGKDRNSKKIESTMKRMGKPYKSMKALAKSQKFKDRNFSRYYKTLKRDTDNFLKIKHKDEAFNDMSADLKEAMKELEACKKFLSRQFCQLTLIHDGASLFYYQLSCNA